MKLWQMFTNLIIKKTLLFKNGAVIKATQTDGTVTDIDLAELAAINSIAASDLAKIDGITNGTVAAGKAVVVDSNKDASAFRDVTVRKIIGSTDPLNLDGLAAAQGGAATVTGGTSSTAGNAGGEAKLVGGTPGATGVGGAATVVAAAGGATSGNGGVASVTGGAGTAGNATGGVGKTVGGAGQGSAAGGKGQVTGGAGGATGAGGAAEVTGGAGGATSGTGGAATITGGAGTAGNSAGGAASVTGGAGQGTAAGGAASLVGGASGAGATGNGGAVSVTGGAAASTNGNGGSVILAGGAKTGTGVAGMIIERSVRMVAQGAQTAKTTSATLTAAEVLAGIITVNQGGGATSSLTLPLAADMDTAMPDSAAGDAFDFSLINVSTVAAEDADILTNTGWTLVGSMAVQSNAAITDKSAGRFRARKTGAGAWTLYRLS